MTESALEPRLHTVGVVDGKLPPGIYSARDSEAMYTFTDSAKVKQGAYRIENEVGLPLHSIISLNVLALIESLLCRA